MWKLQQNKNKPHHALLLSCQCHFGLLLCLFHAVWIDQGRGKHTHTCMCTYANPPTHAHTHTHTRTHTHTHNQRDLSMGNCVKSPLRSLSKKVRTLSHV